MDKNLVTAIALSLLVYVAWFGFLEKRYVRPAAKPGVASAAKPATSLGAAQPAAAISEPADRGALERESFSIDLGGVSALVEPRGAALVSYKYPDPLGDVELVQNPVPGFFSTWPDLTFSQEKAGSRVFTARRPDGLVIRKEYAAAERPDKLPLLRVTMTNSSKKTLETGSWIVSIGPGLGTVASEKEENPKLLRAIGLTAAGNGTKGKIEAFKPGDHPAGYRWVGVDNRYFLAAIIPPASGVQGVAASAPAQTSLQMAGVSLAPGQSAAVELPFYLGAKGHTWLRRFDAGLERSVDFGFFAQLGRLILQFLGRLHSLTGNWGWSIILLTVLLQLALSPLTYKSLRAAAAMKKLQPEIAKLQQRHAKDPQRMNAEMMELYKRTGANPLGGCLPMLMQMPIFIALFNTLRNAWELHGAPWIGWVHDLSAHDPFYILPVVMGGLMYLQNSLNAAATDPSQAMMMKAMPLIFTVMFLKFPAGLVLYWLTNSIMSAAQQLALKSHFEKTLR
jgi:YidC/Oxa1 family membrane protein insertase